MNLFEKFFQAKLRPEDHQELAEKRQDPKFEAEFQSYQRAFRAIQHQGEAELKARLQAKEKNRYSKSDKQHIRQLARRVLQIAAVLLVTLLATLLWHRTTTPNNYLTEYFSPALNTALPSLRGNMNQNIDTPFQQALMAYNQRDYQKAIEYFQHIDADSLQETATFYQANAHLALANSHAAIPLLQKLTTTNNYFQYQSRWYLALAYLDEGDIQSARVLLKALGTESGSYQAEADRILLSLPE